MKKLLTMLLLLTLLLGIAGFSRAVNYTEDGALIVDGNGSDDLPALPTAQPGTASDPYFPIVPDDEEDGDIAAPAASSGPGPTWAPADVIYFTLLRDNGVEEPVTLLSAGTLYSKISIGQATEMVRTDALQYERTATVTQEKRYALVNAKKTGYATMYLRGSAKSDVVGRCTTNRVVLVLDAGKSFTRVWCEGKVGYLKTSSLIFLPPAGREVDVGVLTYEGRTNSRAAITIRQNGKATSRSLGTVPCGSDLVIFSAQDDGWLEVEVGGWRGWVQEQYVSRGFTMNPALALVSPTPAPILTTQSDSGHVVSFVYGEPDGQDDRTGASGSGMNGN
ncbi:MAG: hypothetical protein IKH77_09355 [Clostridia bacterium]|nr:hypothetical protein [Clostridia bacterium]